MRSVQASNSKATIRQLLRGMIGDTGEDVGEIEMVSAAVVLTRFAGSLTRDVRS